MLKIKGVHHQPDTLMSSADRITLSLMLITSVGYLDHA